MSGTLTGTGTLLKALVRYEGRIFAPWILVVTLLSASSALVYDWIFPSLQERQVLTAAVSGNPALTVIFGSANDLLSVDRFTIWRGLALGGFLAALGTILTITRTTRAQEDSGQAELLASGVLGRSARLMAPLLLVCSASTVLGLVAGTVTALCGASWGVSLLLGATFTTSGWVFGAWAAVSAQLAEDSHMANNIAIGTLAVLFLARGSLDTLDAPGWTTWVNPLGWLTETFGQSQSNSSGRWWPLLLAVALTVFLSLLAFRLHAGRDFSQGVVATSPGPAQGRIRGPWGLTWRLHRGVITVWSLAFIVLGVVFGYMSGSVEELVGSGSGFATVLTGGASDPAIMARAFLTTILSLTGIIATVPGVQIMIRLRTEEMEFRVEPLLATPLTRIRMFLAPVSMAVLVSTALILIAGTVISVFAAHSGTGIAFSDGIGQALVTIPAVWAVVAVAVFMIGARPTLAVAAWVGVVASFALTLLGPTFRLPGWALGISPFHHIPTIGGPEHTTTGLLVVGLIAVVLMIVGTAAFRRRDIA